MKYFFENFLRTLRESEEKTCTSFPRIFHEMKILSECKRFLSYGGLDTDQFIHINGKRIPRALPRTIIILALLLLGISAIINCIINYADGLQAILFPLDILLVVIMKLTSYVALLCQTEKIAELIEYLQMVIQQRMFGD